MKPWLSVRLALFLVATGGDVSAAPDLPDEVAIRGVEFVRIPAGEFWYTASLDDEEARRGGTYYRWVKAWLGDYYIGKYEARARDFVAFLNSPAASSDLIGDDEVRTPEKRGCAVAFDPSAGYAERFPGSDLPATAVSWELADAFARWMGFRLPTEAEWQKAARGSDQRIWPWGNDYPDDTLANYAFAGNCRPAPVNSFPAGRSPYGLYNMAGNVSEWTASWSNSTYDKGLNDGVRHPDPPRQPFIRAARVAKGGRWGSIAAGVSISIRHSGEIGGFNDSSGVRFAIDSTTVRGFLAQHPPGEAAQGTTWGVAGSGK